MPEGNEILNNADRRSRISEFGEQGTVGAGFHRPFRRDVIFYK